MAANAGNEIEPQIALARMLLANQDRAGAQQTLNGVTRLAAFDPDLQLEIALLQIAAGNLAGASYSLDKSLSGRPDFLPAMTALVDVEVATGRLADAEARARRILKLHPKLGVGHTLLGDVHWARQQREQALRHYRDAHATLPETRTALKLASALQAEGQSAAAVTLLKGWVGKHKDDVDAQRVLASMHMQRGEWPAAQATYRQLLGSRPQDALLLNDLANALLPTDPAAALKAAEQALAAAPTDARVIDTVGWVLFQNGQTDRALQLLRDARLRQPGNPTIRYHLGAVLARLGRPGEAREELRAALASTPRFEGDAAARELLQSLP
jgi:cellulose synthase operon protein C